MVAVPRHDGSAVCRDLRFLFYAAVYEALLQAPGTLDDVGDVLHTSESYSLVLRRGVDVLFHFCRRFDNDP